jgi:eukaryotic-like serine/threonine-protein kinase
MNRMANREDRIYDLEQALLEFPSSEWAERLRHACPEDPDLAADVLHRLATLDETPDCPALNLSAGAGHDGDGVPDPLVGHTVGPFRILRRLPQQGAMGTVYQAAREDAHLFGQLAVIKVLRPGLTDRRFVRRFNLERTVLARLSHPGIVQVFDAGTLGDGRPYYVMEWIDQALPLDVYCHVNGLRITERLGLFRRVCAAVSHAHQQRVLHRDLKPANILVTKDGEPKILDFGLAKLLGDEQRASLSLVGEWVGTPEYASPEQIRGEALTEQSDQYALGMILFELLTGRLPYRLPAVTRAAWAAVINAVASTEAPRPSAVVSVEARTSGVHPPQLRGDLDALVLQCLRKDAASRYPSVAQLSDDIDRFLAGAPVQARLPSAGDRLVRLARRHRLLAAAGVLVLISLLAALAVSRAAHRSSMEVQARAVLRAATEAFDKDPTTAATLLASIGPDVEPDGGRTLGAKLLLAPLATIIRTKAGAVTDVAFSPNGETVALGSADGSVRLWNVSGEGQVSTLTGHRGAVSTVRFSRDGRLLLTASADGTARVWRIQKLESPVVLSGHRGFLRDAEFSPDGSLVVTAGEDRTARVWHPDGTGQALVLRGHEGEVLSASFSPDGLRLITASVDGTARVWWADGHGRPLVLRGHAGSVNVAVFSPGGELIATAGDDGSVRLWQLDGKCLRTLSGSRGPVKACAFDASGSRIVAGDADGSVRVFDVKTGDVGSLAGHRAPITSVQCSSRGAILSGSDDGDARLSEQPGASDLLEGHEGPIRCVRFSPDGRRAITGGADGTARVWWLYQTPPEAAESMLANPVPKWPEIVQALRARVRSCLTVAERRHYLGESEQEAGQGFAACEASHGRGPEPEPRAAVVRGVKTLAAVLEEPIPATSVWRVDSQRVTATGCVLEITRRFTLLGSGERRSFVVRLDLSAIQDGRIRNAADQQAGPNPVEKPQDYVSMRTIGGSKTIEFTMFDGAGSQIDNQVWSVLTTEVNPAAKGRALTAMQDAIAACRAQ